MPNSCFQWQDHPCGGWLQMCYVFYIIPLKNVPLNSIVWWWWKDDEWDVLYWGPLDFFVGRAHPNIIAWMCALSWCPPWTNRNLKQQIEEKILQLLFYHVIISCPHVIEGCDDRWCIATFAIVCETIAIHRQCECFDQLVREKDFISQTNPMIRGGVKGAL